MADHSFADHPSYRAVQDAMVAQLEDAARLRPLILDDEAAWDRYHDVCDAHNRCFELLRELRIRLLVQCAWCRANARVRRAKGEGDQALTPTPGGGHA